MPRQQAPAVQPPWRWQTVATVLLMLHVFSVCVAVVANAGGGRSFFGQSLGRVPLVRQYAALLNMDLAYDFELAGTEPDQGVHELRLLLPSRSDSSQPSGKSKRLATLPDGAVWPRIRRQRFQQLAYNVAYFDRVFADNADLRTQLPVAIAEAWLRELDVRPPHLVLVCQRMPSPRLPKALATAPAPLKEGGPRKTVEGPPPVITVELVWDADDQRYLGSRPAPEGEAAQVARHGPPVQDGGEAPIPGGGGSGENSRAENSRVANPAEAQLAPPAISNSDDAKDSPSE